MFIEAHSTVSVTIILKYAEEIVFWEAEIRDISESVGSYRDWLKGIRACLEKVPFPAKSLSQLNHSSATLLWDWRPDMQ